MCEYTVNYAPGPTALPQRLPSLLPTFIVRQPLPVTRQDAFVQPPQVIDHMCPNQSAAIRSHLAQTSIDPCQAVFRQVGDHAMHSILDERPVRQPRGVWVREILLDGQVLLCGAFVSPSVEVAQQFSAGQFVNAEHRVRSTPAYPAKCRCCPPCGSTPMTGRSTAGSGCCGQTFPPGRACCWRLWVDPASGADAATVPGGSACRSAGMPSGVRVCGGGAGRGLAWRQPGVVLGAAASGARLEGVAEAPH